MGYEARHRGRRESETIPQEALLIIKLEAVKVEVLFGPSLHAREAQAHIEAGVQVLWGQLVHPRQEVLAQLLYQLTVHLWYYLGKKMVQVRSQSHTTSKLL